jgi:drug/metabolite transporter (DMT)-like permease
MPFFGEGKLSCCTAEFVLVSLVLFVYLALNIGLNYYNNWLLSPPPTGLGFPAPLFYTMCHMVASLLGSTALMACRPELRTLSWEQFWARKYKLGILSTLFCISIAANNLSLPHIGLSVNQVLKSCTALPVLFLAFVLEGKRYSLPKVGLIVLIVVGAVVAVPWGTPNADGLGVALSIISTLAIAGKTSLSALLMKDAKKDGLTPIVLVWYDSIFSILLLFIAQILMGEWYKIRQFSSDRTILTLVAMLLGSFMAFTYNFVSFKFIQMTSSVTHAIAGNLKLFAVVVLPAMFIDHITSVTSWVGFGIFLAAALGYAVLEQKNMRAPGHNTHIAATAPTDKKSVPSEETPLRKEEAPSGKKGGWF